MSTKTSTQSTFIHIFMGKENETYVSYSFQKHRKEN